MFPTPATPLAGQEGSSPARGRGRAAGAPPRSASRRVARGRAGRRRTRRAPRPGHIVNIAGNAGQRRGRGHRLLYESLDVCRKHLLGHHLAPPDAGSSGQVVFLGCDQAHGGDTDWADRPANLGRAAGPRRLSNPEIGTRLFISPRPVQYHLSMVSGSCKVPVMPASSLPVCRPAPGRAPGTRPCPSRAPAGIRWRQIDHSGAARAAVGQPCTAYRTMPLCVK
jgi:hypothetical protein